MCFSFMKNNYKIMRSFPYNKYAEVIPVVNLDYIKKAAPVNTSQQLSIAHLLSFVFVFVEFCFNNPCEYLKLTRI